MALCLCSPLLPSSSTLVRRNLASSKPPMSLARHTRLAATAQITAPPPPQRKSAVYQPNLWDYGYIQSLKSDHSIDEVHARRVEVLKEEVRRMINKEKEAVDQLELVDDLRQLGVAYHFEEEIKGVLGAMPVSIENVRTMFKGDLRATALLFRLLRDHGSFISQDAFDSFKDETGDFKACLCEDTKGMLSLYEASHFAMEAEDTLDEARAFTTNYLKGLSEESLDPCLAEHVAHALDLPMNWRAPRVQTRWFIDVYERDEDMNPILLEFAKLDFNMVQRIYQSDLKEASRWWTNLGFGEKLVFARDRLMECFLFTVGWGFEPKFRTFRVFISRFNALITTIDDVYDFYGSIDELELFTDAVERWDVNAMEQLPEYMKICYLALFNSMNEIAYDVLRNKGMDIIPYLKQAVMHHDLWANQCKSYLVEAKWYHSGYKPTLMEYMDNALITIGVPAILTYTYFDVSQNKPSEVLEYLKSCSTIIRHSSMLLRLSNDLGTSTDEINRGDVPKSIQCRMHEGGVSEVVAREDIKDLISDIWKKLNKDRFALPTFVEPFVNIAVNIPRMGQCIYNHGDDFGKPDHEAKNRAMALLIEPISLKRDG